MPDKQYAGTNYASYTPSNFKAIFADGINLMGWFGTQNKFYTKYWTDTVSDGTNDVSTVTVNNSTCTSIMRTESCIRQELNISRSDLADGYALTNHSTYVEAVQSDIIYFRAANVEQNVTVSNTSYDIASGTYGNSVVKSPYATVAGTDYQIAYWYGGAAANATPDNPNVSQLGWNLLYGDGGAVYFDPLPTGFNFTTTTLTEADFADEDSITLYGLVTVPEASTGNWGWKAVVELTVNLVD